ncbi:putative ankyrin repeat protein [Chloropicon roscoffensis]|uniref:Ankyrin repeat protein n=1 Tax=Chloropicon roscoffensis TaxID=1461544 RepID=A0AAX4PH39_9CHLO
MAPSRRRRVDGVARGAESTSSAKRAKVDEAKEEEDPLVRRKEELVVAAKEARSREDARAERVARRELLTLCDDFEAKNEKLLGRLLPELWEKITGHFESPDLLAFAMTCRFFREKQKDLKKKMETIVGGEDLVFYAHYWKVTSHSLGWFRWVCDTFKILPGYEKVHMNAVGFRYTGRLMEPFCGDVYEGVLLNYAAFQGSVEILRWLMEEKGCKLNKNTGWYAGVSGSVEVLEHMRGRGYKFTKAACEGAAMGGCLEALKFLRGPDPPCPWDEETCVWAAQGGHLDVLKWLRSQDPPCPWDEVMICGCAAGVGHLDVLKWLRSQDPPCPWDEWTCTCAALGGHLDVLKWLRSQDPPCPWDKVTCSEAAKGGHLEVLKWLRDQDPPCPWSRSKCRRRASKYGHQHIVDWIDQQEDESEVEFSDSDSD